MNHNESPLDPDEIVSLGLATLRSWENFGETCLPRLSATPIGKGNMRRSGQVPCRIGLFTLGDVLLLIDPSYVSSKWILDQPIWCSGEIWPGRWDRSRLVAPSVPLASLIAQEMARLRFHPKNQLCSVPTQLPARAHPLLHSSRFPEGVEGFGKKRRQIEYIDTNRASNGPCLK